VRRLGKGLLILAIGLALVWSSLWFGLSELAKRQTAAWFEMQALSGRMAGHDGIRVSGFPLRFEMLIDAPYLANPFTGQSWAAPFARIEATATPPLNLRLPLAPTHTLLLGGHEVVTLSGSAMQANLRLDGTALAFGKLTAAASEMRAEGRSGWAASLGALALDIAVDAGSADSLALTASATALRADAGALAAFGADTSGAGNSPLETPLDATITAALRLDAPLDWSGSAEPRLREIAIDNLQIVWGTVDLSGSGTLQITETGQPDGALSLRLRDGRALLSGIVALGLLHPEVAETWENMLATMEEDGALDIRLTFRNGRTWLGPLPLGPAPVIWR